MAPPLDLLSKDGFDLQWGTNVVGHWYFATLLMPALLAGVASSPDGHARVVTTSSGGAYLNTPPLGYLPGWPGAQKDVDRGLVQPE